MGCLVGIVCAIRLGGVPRKVETNAASPSRLRPRRRERPKGEKAFCTLGRAKTKNAAKVSSFRGEEPQQDFQEEGRKGEEKTFVCVREEAKLKHGEGGQRGYRVGRQQGKLVMERGEERRTAGPSSYKLHTKV